MATERTAREPLISDEEILATIGGEYRLNSDVVARGRALLALHRKRIADMLRAGHGYRESARLIEESE